MRRGQRFTTTKLDNWTRQGRGTGTLTDYSPWHQVTRGDPSSRGRSQLLQWSHTGRSHHFLSDGESDVFAFISMLPNIVDVREQVPLNLEEHTAQVAAYSAKHQHQTARGTLACAEMLGFKHPVLRSCGETAPWVMTTDFVVTLEAGAGQYELLAISVKPDNDLVVERKRQLLQLEREYWSSQFVQWLLIAPQVYDRRVSGTLRSALPWGLPKLDTDLVATDHLLFCAANESSFEGMSLTEALRWLSSRLGVSIEPAQRTFWQAVWKGIIKLDLRRTGWPSEPIHLLSEAEFLELNPIAMRRSVCI